MARKPHVYKKSSAKPPKILVGFALLAVVVLSFFIVKTFHTKKLTYTRRVLTLPKEQTTVPLTNNSAPSEDWRIVTTKPKDTMGSIFRQLGLSQQSLNAILNHNPNATLLTRIQSNVDIRFLIKNHELLELVLPAGNHRTLHVKKAGTHYVSEVKSQKMATHHQYVTATVKGSLYGTANRLNIPLPLIKQMTDIFNWEINFAKDIRAGDQFTIVYEASFIENKMVNTGNIIAVSYTNRGKLHQAFRFESRQGSVDYYSEQGNSLRKAFSRYPLKFSHISSTFNLSRRHPILHYNRPHYGVDLAAAIGTPIYATGDGIITSIGRQNGYGNMIKITHSKMYSSIYGHMLKFQKGLSRGHHIKRGEVIGYVGQTGLASGPHCHYEFHVNNRPRNPTTVDLPRSLPIAGRELAAFRSQTKKMLAQMKLYESAHLAAQKSSSDKG